MSKADIRQRGNRHSAILRGYSWAMSEMSNQPRSLIARWRSVRLIVMPLIIVGAGLWISSAQSRSANLETDRVRILLTQLLEESARGPAQLSNALQGSDPVVIEEFRLRLQRAAGASKSKAALVIVQPGDFGAGALGSATHTALACYKDSERVAVRVIAISGDSQVKLVGVFTPDEGDFAVQPVEPVVSR